MERTSVMVVGGFLGAGKTTLIGAAALKLQATGRRVGVVTNDQTGDCVDTVMFARRGVPVREVAGSCFCCDFPGLVTCLESLREEGCEVILAETVGSCADISATVLQPLKDRHSDRFSLLPLTVVVDPMRLGQARQGTPSLDRPLPVPPPLHESAAYIVGVQREEADILLVNKIDALDGKLLRACIAELQDAHPRTRTLGASALTGEGVDEWLALVRIFAHPGGTLAAVDYDVYAEGEGVLGWLNAVAVLRPEGEGTDWRGLCGAFLAAMDDAFGKEGVCIGHVKLLLHLKDGEGELTASLVATGGGSPVKGAVTGSGDGVLVVNARVETSPEGLRNVVETALESCCEAFHVEPVIETMRCLRPGRPRPTWRYDAIVG
ncbi:MAG: hypothetical protein LBR22_08765 [Desulfovibrio sp.]|jgi:Ni2+-binding GTPase involved in maturation of urease and hydrogenase|nr:hypothetical protein [Desulfovibrio sp.]